jgi:hypothetical protein
MSTTTAATSARITADDRAIASSKPLTRETRLMTYDGVLEVALAAGQEGERQHSAAA